MNFCGSITRHATSAFVSDKQKSYSSWLLEVLAGKLKHQTFEQTALAKGNAKGTRTHEVIVQNFCLQQASSSVRANDHLKPSLSKLLDML